MKTRILRFLLLAILVAAGAGSVSWTWTLAQHVDRLEATGRQSAARIDRLEGLLDELTRDELTYVASGQIDKETLTSTSNRVRQVTSESAWLLGQLLAGGAPSAGALAEGVASLAEIDARARENMQADLDLMAADLLFTETTRMRQTLREQLRMLRLAESNAVAEGRSNDLQQAWIGTGRCCSPVCVGTLSIHAVAVRGTAERGRFRHTRQGTRIAERAAPKTRGPADRPDGSSRVMHGDQPVARRIRSTGIIGADRDTARRIGRCRLDGGW